MINLTNVNAVATLMSEVGNGKIFFAEFQKKDGTIRTMSARKGVRIGVNGKGMAYNPHIKGLLGVFDMGMREFRMINLNGLVRFSANGKKYKVVR